MQSILLTKPIKNIPDKLFYKSKTLIQNSIHDEYSRRLIYPAFQYNAVNTKTGEFSGTMIAAPMKYSNPAKRFYPYKHPYKSFFINYLSTENHHQGFGKAFIELAKNESKKYNCKGRVHLIASRIYDRTNPPHIFYKKCGFISQSEDINKYLDTCINSNTQMDYFLADNLEMFLPIKEQDHKKSIQILTKLTSFLKKLL